MKICLVVSSLSGGGAERIVVNLANYYSSKGYDVCLVVFNAIGPYKDQLNASVSLIDLASRTRSVFWKLFWTLRNIRPTVILSAKRDSNIVIGCLSYFFNTLVVFREANTFEQVYRQGFLKRWVYFLLMRLAYRQADLVIANSEDTADDLKRSIAPVSVPVQVIGNPVVPANLSIRLEESSGHHWLGCSRFSTILNVGRLHEQKNQRMLIHSFATVHAKLPYARLVILGDGSLKGELLDLAEELGIGPYVEILEFVANPFPFYKEADVFVLSSDWEGFGNVLVEALVSKVPIISTDCRGGPRKILDNGKYGELVPTGDVKALSDVIVRQLNSGAISSEGAEERYRRGMEYSLERVAELYLNSIQMMVKKPGNN